MDKVHIARLAFFGAPDALPGPYAWKFHRMRLLRQLAWAKIGGWWLVYKNAEQDALMVQKSVVF